MGDGTTTQRNTPTAVSGGMTWTSISATQAATETCGVKSGTQLIYCWGNNGNGQVGDNSTTNRSVPTQSYYFVTSAQTNMSFTVDPAFTFTVAGRSSVCNGQSGSNFQTGSTGTAVGFAHLSSSTIGGGAQDLTVSTNAGSGFIVYLRTAGSVPNVLRDTNGHSITDVAGTHSSPGVAPVPGTAGFGYTTNDASVAFGANKWAAIDNVSRSVLGGTGAGAGTACVGYEVAVSPTTPAAAYSASIIYTAVPTF